MLDSNVTVEHGNKGTQKPMMWISEHYNMVEAKMPTNGQIHLPSYENRKGVNELYTEEMKTQLRDDSDQIIAMTTFYKMW